MSFSPFASVAPLRPTPGHAGAPLSKTSSIESLLGEWDTLAAKYWMSNGDTEAFFMANVNQVFSLHMKTVNWLIREDVDLPPDGYDEYFIANAQYPAHTALLFENMRFALRANKRGAALLMKGTAGMTMPKDPLPEISFGEYMSLSALSVPPYFLGTLRELLLAVLKIEFSTAACSLLKEQKAEATETRILQLAEFVATAGQDFGATARTLAPERTAPDRVEPATTDDEMAENRELSEVGLESLWEV